MIHFIADVHLGNHRQHGGAVKCGLNTRCREALSVFAQVCKLESTLVVLGDLLDGVRPRPQLLTAVQRLVWSRSSRTYLLVGNHEQVSAEPGDHSLGTFAPYQGATGERVIDEPYITNVHDAHVAMLPYSTEPAPEYVAHWLREAFRNVSIGTPRALCMHFGVVDANTPPYLRDNPDAIELSYLVKLCDQYGISKVFAAHWHQPRTWLQLGKSNLTDVYQVGTLVPPGWREEGFGGYGRVVSWDPATNSVTEQHVHGPRFASCTTMMELEQIAYKHQNDIVRVRWTVPPEAVEASREYAAQVMAEAPNVAAVGILPEAQQQAVADARAAAASNVEDDVEAFVAGMRLPDGVEPAVVVNRSRGFLEG